MDSDRLRAAAPCRRPEERAGKAARMDDPDKRQIRDCDERYVTQTGGLDDRRGDSDV